MNTFMTTMVEFCIIYSKMFFLFSKKGTSVFLQSVYNYVTILDFDIKNLNFCTKCGKTNHNSRSCEHSHKRFLFLYFIWPHKEILQFLRLRNWRRRDSHRKLDKKKKHNYFSLFSLTETNCTKSPPEVLPSYIYVLFTSSMLY